MGWASGSELLGDIVELAEENLELREDTAVDFYRQLIDLFESHDCDTIDDCEGICDAMDEAINQWRIDNGYEKEW